MSLQDLYDLTNFNLELIQETEFWKIKKKKTIIALFKRAAYSNSKFSIFSWTPQTDRRSRSADRWRRSSRLATALRLRLPLRQDLPAPAVSRAKPPVRSARYGDFQKYQLCDVCRW